MNRARRLAIAGFAAVGLAAALLARWGQDRPVATFTSVRGERTELAQLRGHPLVVTFWASDCRTCLLEIPEFELLSEDYRLRGVRVFAVAMRYDVPSRVLSLVRESGLGYTVVLDSDGRLASAFGGVEWVPSTFVLDSGGRVRDRIAGAVDFRRVRQQIETLLGES
jgi:peroxiredoxin